jgi:hypothetical protein
VFALLGTIVMNLLLHGESMAAGARMALLTAALAATALALLVALGRKPEHLLEGGFEVFLKLPPFCSSSWATRLISCSNSARSAGGVASQSEALTPADGENISDFLVLTSMWLPRFCQGRRDWSRHTPRTLTELGCATGG